MLRIFTLVCTALLLVACGQAKTGKEPAAQKKMETVQSTGKIVSVDTTLDSSKHTYHLQWVWAGTSGPVTISMATKADAPAAKREVIAKDIVKTDFSFTAPGDLHRRYFFLTPQHGVTVKTAVRLLPLEGGRNFRDLGGYKTADGKTVKWGKLFRSGTMANVTARDYRYLSDMGIQTLVDFRTSDERKSEPTKWKAGDAEYLFFPDPVARNGESSFAAIFSDPKLTPEKVAQGMANHYPQIAKDQIPAYTVMFDRIAAGKIPLSFNCAAGKDRTGTAAALILTALGVPRETVVKDYALSETYVDFMKAFMGEGGDKKAKDNEPDSYAFLRRLPPELIAPLMRSDPRYIQTTFDWMDKEYGGPMNFIQTELDVTDDELRRIRAQLLE